MYGDEGRDPQPFDIPKGGTGRFTRVEVDQQTAGAINSIRKDHPSATLEQIIAIARRDYNVTITRDQVVSHLLASS